ncbi:LexA/Signal peptidase [Ophiobolus disseminans]|uniref:Mitochondrial inner membrane protease subunit n=1 Tax=Ophiobolus disseminans TaxID=1469910 RepID=A0A6A6ZN34_9PLEO|nr:LexA/Signal peptidase [Ophiobolus disseminans]
MAPRLANPHEWSRIAFNLSKVALVVHIFQRYIGGISPTAGMSMVPTIPVHYHKRPYILYSSLHRRGRGVKVGDVITYKSPVVASSQGCKRIVGMPGDFVSVVTPGRRDEDIEAVDVDGRWASLGQQVVQVPEGHCWVAGDNLEWSRDSRLFGPVPLGLVTGKVLAVMLPLSDAKWLGGELDVKDVQEKEHEWVIKR